MSKVSIVIPVYNAEKYLKECIDSALNQTYSDIEVIAINDGSTDGSLDILKKYQDKIKIITKENGGTASALNVGIKNMTGEWFKWLSADDLLYPNAVDELVKTSKIVKNFKKTIFYTNYDIINSEGKRTGVFIEPNYNNLSKFDFNLILLDHYIGNATTSLIHKSALDKYGLFDETIGYAEDYELWLRYCLLNNFKLFLIPNRLSKYRVHKSQLTSKKLNESMNHAKQVRGKIMSKLKPFERDEYELKLKNIVKTKSSLISQTKRKFWGFVMKTLPEKISSKIIKWYLDRKYPINY